MFVSVCKSSTTMVPSDNLVPVTTLKSISEDNIIPHYCTNVDYITFYSDDGYTLVRKACLPPGNVHVIF